MSFYHNIFIIIIIIIFNLTSFLVAQNPPRLLLGTENPEKRFSLPGTSVSIKCPVDKKQDDFIFYEWFKNDVQLDNVDNRIKININNGVLKIKQTIVDDTGFYKCKAINGFGSVEHGIIFIVDENPDIIKDMKENSDSRIVNYLHKGKSGSPPKLKQVSDSTATKPVKSTISFKCLAYGSPEPTITWYHNNNQLPDTETRKDRYSLVINDLKLDDSGNYTCIASNLYGSTKANYKLQVVDDNNIPRIQESYLVNDTVFSGGIATFQCLVKSNTVPDIKWLKQAHHNETFEKQKSFRNEKFRKIKVQNENYYVFQESPQIFQSPNGDYFSKLVIENVKESHTGKYACWSSNSQGDYALRSAFLKVLPSKIEHSVILFGNSDSIPRPILLAFFICFTLVFVFIMVCCLRFCCNKYNNNNHQETRLSESPFRNNLTKNETKSNTDINAPSIYKYNNLPSKKSQFTELIPSDNPKYPEYSKINHINLYHQYGHYQHNHLRLYEV